MRELIENLHEGIITQIAPIAGSIPIGFILIGGVLVSAAVIVGWMSFLAMFWIYLERRVAGVIQARWGPNRVGPLGILQSAADGIKLLFKEDIIPRAANRFLYEVAPLLVFAGAFIPFIVLPFSRRMVIADMDLGLFYILAFGAIEVVGILMAGWAPNSKWSLYGGMRLAAQMLSYEIPLGLSILVIVVLSGTLNLTDMIEWQTQGLLWWDATPTPSIGGWEPLGFLHWGIFRAPWVTIPAFVIFWTAALAETKRAPFDLPEAESELVSGFHTEYTGIRFSYFFLAEYCAMYVMCLVAAVVFFGGWYYPLPTPDLGPTGVLADVTAGLADVTYADLGPWATVKHFVKTLFVTAPSLTWSAVTEPHAMKAILSEAAGFVNIVGKAFFFLFVMIWIRWTIPRVRIDQVIHICLKVLLPLSLACVMIASIQAAFTVQAPEPPEAGSPPAATIAEESAAAPEAELDVAPQTTETSVEEEGDDS